MTNISKTLKAASPKTDLTAAVSAPKSSERLPFENAGGVNLAGTDLAAMAAGKVKATGTVDLGWRPSIDAEELSGLEARMLEISNLIVKKDAPKDAEVELASLLARLTVPMTETLARLEALKDNMRVEAETFSWWTRNIDNPASYDDKQKVEKELGAWLEQASAIRGGARIALRVRQEQKQHKSPETWQGEQDNLHVQAGAAKGTATWSKEIAALARFQGELRNEAAATRAEASGRANDLDEYDDITWFWQRSKFLDILTFGESEKGRVFRAGRDQTVAADDLADRFEAVFAKGEDQLHASINQLLIKEDPNGYAVTRAHYDVVKPAFDALRGVQTQARTVLSELSDVESAISHAAMIRMQEPSQTVTRTNHEGKLETVPNPDHDSWKSRLSWAESAIISAKSDVQSALSRLNGMLPGLAERLAAAELKAYIGNVSSEMSTWNNWLGMFGGVVSGFAGWASWSYDQGQVSSVRSDIHALETKLAPVDAIITPKFEGLHAEVWRRIGERRAELVDKGA